MLKRNPESDRYGDGDVPESDYEPYRNNKYDPHPETGRNHKYTSDSSTHKNPNTI